MSQLHIGTCSVTNGSATVNAAAGVDWTGIGAGDLFAVNNVVYAISATATFTGGIWHLTLTAPYGGTTNALADYTIHRDFEPLYGFPIFAVGDTQVVSILNRCITMFATALQSGGGGGGGGDGASWHKKTIAGADVNAVTIAMVFPGAPLATVPKAMGRPVFIKGSPTEANIDAVSIDSITVNGYNVNLSGPAVVGQILTTLYVP